MIFDRKLSLLVIFFILISVIGCDTSYLHAGGGRQYYKKGNYAKAVEYLEKAIKINPVNGPAHYYLALSYIKLGSEAQASELLASYFAGLANTSKYVSKFDQENIAQCRSLLQEIGLAHGAAQWMNAKTEEFAKQKQFGAALALSSETAQIFPNDGEARYDHGIELYRQGVTSLMSGDRSTGLKRLDEAEAELNVAIELFKGDPKRNHAVAAAYRVFGENAQRARHDLKKAEYFFKKALELNPNEEAAKKGLESLSNV